MLGKVDRWILLVALLFVGRCSAPQEAGGSPESATAESSDPGHFEVPFELVDNRIFFELRIGQSEPLRFVLDTGAHMVLEVEVARRLGLAEEGDGDGPFRTRASRVRLGAASFHNMLVTVGPLDEIREGNGFEHLDGLFGLARLHQYVLTIDHHRGRLELVDARDFEHQGDAPSATFTLHNHVPVIEAEIDGLAAELWLDIGERSELTLTTPFIEQHDLIERYQPTPGMITSWSGSGPMRTRVARVGEVQLGPVTLTEVAARFPGEDAGPYQSDTVAGSLGNGLLSRRDLTIDQSRGRLIFGPQPPTVQGFDRAGIWWVLREGTFAVGHVAVESPAAAAGVEPGDQLVALGEREGSEVTLSRIRSTLSSPQTGEVELRLRGDDGGERTVELQLRDLL